MIAMVASPEVIQDTTSDFLWRFRKGLDFHAWDFCLFD
jgi:hypothetical protein